MNNLEGFQKLSPDMYALKLEFYGKTEGLEISRNLTSNKLEGIVKVVHDKEIRNLKTVEGASKEEVASLLKTYIEDIQNKGKDSFKKELESAINMDNKYMNTLP